MDQELRADGCEERVCSSSSEESVLDGDLGLVTVEVDGEEEQVLVPQSASTCPSVSIVTNSSASVDEAALGGTGGCTTLFLSCVSALQKEPIIQRSPRGKKVHELLRYVEEKREEVCVTEVALFLVTKLYACLVCGDKYKLPSVALGCMWSSFHKVRNNDAVSRVWSTFITTIKAPEACCLESHLALQLLMDRVLKKMIENKAKAVKQLSSVAVAPLTIREKSAMRYMAGYVAVKLLKRYKKPSNHPQVQLKRRLFVRILTGMSVADQPATVETLEDYTRLWSELVDRGGLYHINDEVLCLLEEVELVVRRHLNVRSMQTYDEGTNICLSITEEVLTTNSVLCCWETIAHSIPLSYEEYSIELLKAVVNLWITVRAHAFAKGWTMKFEKKYKKGTRKSLQPQRVED